MKNCRGKAIAPKMGKYSVRRTALIASLAGIVAAPLASPAGAQMAIGNSTTDGAGGSFGISAPGGVAANASGVGTIAVGLGAAGSNNASIAIGFDSSSTGGSSSALGIQSNASGIASTAIGD